MNQAFSIKFEASIRPVNLKKGTDYQLVALSSKITSLTVLAQVASLERIKKKNRQYNRQGLEIFLTCGLLRRSREK